MDSHFNLIYDLLPPPTKHRKTEGLEKPVKRENPPSKGPDEEEMKDP